MGRNFLIESSNSSEIILPNFAPFDDRTLSVKSYLIHQLEPTPRRKLFDEFESKLTKLTEELIQDKQFKEFTSAEGTIKSEMNHLAELNDFRLKNPNECMSDLSLRRFKRAQESEENFLKHSCVHRYHINDRLIPSPVNCDEHGNSLCDLCQRPPSVDNAEIIKIHRPLIVNKSSNIRDAINSQDSHSGPILLLEINEPRAIRKPKQGSKYIPENSLALRHQKRKY